MLRLCCVRSEGKRAGSATTASTYMNAKLTLTHAYTHNRVKAEKEEVERLYNELEEKIRPYRVCQ